MLVFDCFVPESTAAHLFKLSQCSDRIFVYQLSRTDGTKWYLFDQEVKSEGLVTQRRNIRNFH